VSLKTIVGYPVRDEKKAKSILATLSEEWHKSKLAELDKTARITLGEFTDEYISGERADLSRDTLRMDSLALRLLADVTGSSRAVRAIDANDLARFKTVCISRQLSPNTIKTYMRHIRAAVNYAVSQGYRSAPPQFPKIKTPKPIPKTMDPDAVSAILLWARANDREAWRYASFAVWTGCRLSEICNLKWSDITIYGAPINNIHGQAVITGKGDKQRTIYLTAGALDAAGHCERSEAIPKIGRIFHPWTPTTISKKFKAAARAAGHPDAHFHCLRHTAATMMITAGMRFETVREVLGHADIRTTEIYAKCLNTVVLADMAKFALFKMDK
jgi:integrase